MGMENRLEIGYMWMIMLKVLLKSYSIKNILIKNLIFLEIIN